MTLEQDNRANKLHKEHTTNGLRLVPYYKLSDELVQLIWEWREHPSIKPWGYTQEPLPLAYHIRYVAALQSRDDTFSWLALNLDDGKPFGVVSLSRVCWVHRFAWLSISSDPITPRPGVGTQLMRCLDYLAFEVANLHSLRLEVFHTNERAIALYRKCGFTHEGTLREHVCIGGKRLDVLQFGKLKREI
jgi:UDP-4-amino-4,6-dideoxy-N-acetyl-beta-L-altrosamine N-acetyltransferase